MLSYIQESLNNFKNQFIEMSSNKLLYNFNVRNIFKLLTKLSQKDFSRLRQMKRKQVENVIAFINTLTKTYYNKSHTALRLTRDNITYLRLHHEYEISNLINRKLYHQKIGPFKIFEKIKSLIYHLKLSSIMKIYSIMSIIQLKSIIKNDFYNRVRNTNLFTIKEKNENVDPDFAFKYKSYKIKKLLKKRDIEKNIMYLIK